MMESLHKKLLLMFHFLKAAYADNISTVIGIELQIFGIDLRIQKRLIFANVMCCSRLQLSGGYFIYFKVTFV